MSQPVCRYLDAAVLVPSMTREEAVNAIQTCVKISAYSACVRPCDIELAQELCKGTETKVCVVLAFPHGLQLSASKADEARRYVEMGVDEIDMVANYSWVKSGLWDDVKADIAAVSAVTRPAGVPLKVIFETSQLDAAEIKKMVEICIEAEADFVKTSTGFGTGPATPEAVDIMVGTVGQTMGVKAAGGIRSYETAAGYLDQGCKRLGASSTIAILDGIPDGQPGAAVY